jgi:uncharacterized protein YllA (UPF0747 family)
VANIFSHVPYADTGFFSHLVTDYLGGQPAIKPFYLYAPDIHGITQAINERAKYPVNRKALVSALTKQYADLPKHKQTEKNIQLLLKENTFTVCTAHQPNLLTGYLYFIYKILHAIKLAEELGTWAVRIMTWRSWAHSNSAAKNLFGMATAKAVR